MSSFRSLGRDLVVYGIMGGIARSVHLLLLPILTRLFSPEEYGAVDIVAAMTSVLTLTIALTLDSAIARSWFDAGREDEQKQLVSSILAFILFVGTVMVAGIWYQADRIAGVILQDPTSGPYVTLGALAALFTALTHVPQIVLRMQRRISQYTMVTLTQTVSFAGLALLLILRFDAGVMGVFVAQMIGSCLALVVGLSAIWPFLRASLSFRWLDSSLRYSLPLFPAVVVTVVNRYLDRALLLYFLGLGAIGVFAAAARIALVMNLLIEISRQAWTPYSIALIEEKDGRADFYRRALNYYAGSMATVGLIISAYSQEVMALLVPREYVFGYVVIPWLMGAQILNGSSQFTNLGMLITKKTFGNSIAAWTGAVVNIGIGLFLIPRIGIWGAAIGSFVAGLIFTTLLHSFSKKVVDLRFDVGKLFGIMICYVLSCGAFIATYEVIGDPARSLGVRTLLLGIAVSAVVWLSMDDPAWRALRSTVKFKVWVRP